MTHSLHSYWHQPDIDPVLLNLWGPFQIRWYSLLYVGGFLVGREILKYLAKEKRFRFNAEQVEQLILWLLISAVVGARVVYCLAYDFPSLVENPLFLFQVYKGGLSFHGSLLGIILTTIIFSRKQGIPFFNLGDALALATPTGLAMGRLGNFINGELFGRVTDVPWAMIFKNGGPEPRHPSQIYEFLLEGVVLFLVLWWAKRRTQKDGMLMVTFIVGYALCRFIVEFFREADVQVGYLFLGLTMGQLLSLFMLLGGLVTGYLLWKRPVPAMPKGKRR